MNNSKLFAVLMITTLLFLSSGCASVTRGTTDVLIVNSTPSLANVEVLRTNGALSTKELKTNYGKAQAKIMAKEQKDFAGPIIGTTPATFTLARKGEYIVKIMREGYETTIVNITNQISGAGSAGMAGNVLVGGFIGAGVDAGTGAMKDLTPNPVEVTLQPKQ